MRVMARGADGKRTLVELKAVDPAYPLYGAPVAEPPVALAEALDRKDGVWGAVAEPALLTRLGVAPGGSIKVGDATFQLRAALLTEPDRVASIFSLGPRLMIRAEALADTGLIQPGSLIQYGYRLRLADGGDARKVSALLKQRFPHAGWQIRGVEDAAPGVDRFLNNMTVFLTLVGLTSLLIGGIGVANAVKAFIDSRVATIAILKSVGATGGLVLAVYALQTAVMAAAGIAIGVALGALVPFGVAAAAGAGIPLRFELGVYPVPLLLSVVFGALVALAFGLWPLSRAAAIPPTALFRDVVAPLSSGPRRRALLGVAGAVLVLAALTVLTADNRMLAMWFLPAAAATVAAFHGAAALVRRLARRASQTRRDRAGGAALRLGLARLHRPGAVTGSVVVSLGVGLSVLVAIALVQANLTGQIAEKLPEQAPAFYFIDIQSAQAEPFDRIAAAVPGIGEVKRAVMVRGRVTRINGVPAEQAKVDPEAEWVVKGDRGLTVAATPPEGTRVVAGSWWPADHKGPALVSMDAEIAKGFHVGLGDTVTMNVLGRDITATIASLRKIDWSTVSMNFVFVLSPSALEGAPVGWIATARIDPAGEDRLERAVTDALPNVSAIRVRQAIESVQHMLERVGVAVKIAAAVTVVSGALVLAGAVAAGRRRRLYEAVVLKTLGATRRDLLRAYLVEYGTLGAATGVVALAVGSAVAWAVLRLVMHADWVFLPGTAAATVLACIAVALTLGFLGTWRVLGLRAAPHLRNE
jgi:putative ABC transport system permease protein